MPTSGTGEGVTKIDIFRHSYWECDSEQIFWRMIWYVSKRELILTGI